MLPNITQYPCSVVDYYLMTPMRRYNDEISRNLVKFDLSQKIVAEAFDALYLRLMHDDSNQNRLMSSLKKWMGINSTIRGIYLWGGVGRGKTYLMDLFYECLPFPDKRRVHFHRFMLSIHEELECLQGVRNPMNRIAAGIADNTKVLCVDEFFVLDIGDAMLLSGLLEGLLTKGVVFVATSNTHPDSLYADGLQRDSFLPAIKIIKKFTDVIELSGASDYRLRSLTKATLYHFPHNEDSEQHLYASFVELAPYSGNIKKNELIQVKGRSINALYRSDDVIWFDFEILCSSPRGALDYIELARTYHAIVLSKVPQLSEKNEDKARRFVVLIDELYDRRVKLIISADVAIIDIYKGDRLKFEFDRTKSRLIEMQSLDYLASPRVIV